VVVIPRKLLQMERIHAKASLLHAIGLLVLLLTITAKPTLEAQQQMVVKALENRTCTDIRNIDFNNLKFESAGTVFSFHNGKAHSRDCPDCATDSDKPDWEANIEQDKVITPSPNVSIQFLLVDNSHLTGTGSWIHVVGFRCVTADSPVGSRLLKVFDRKGMSLQLERIDNQSVTLTMFTVPGKPIVEHFAYRWDNGSSQFVLDKKWTTRKRLH
jgi:hypothetical protein